MQTNEADLGSEISEHTEATSQIESDSEPEEASEFEFGLSDIDDDEQIETHPSSDNSGNLAYLAACEYLDVIPSSNFLAQINQAKVSLRHDRIGPKGAHAIAECLRFSEIIKDLELSQCNIRAEGAVSIFDAAKLSNAPVEHLRLSGNSIGEGEFLTRVSADMAGKLAELRDQSKKAAKRRQMRGKKEKQKKKEEPTEEELEERRVQQEWEDGLARLDVYQRSSPASEAVAALINGTVSLKTLDLSHNMLTDTFMDVVGLASWDAAPLETVSFAHNKLTDGCAESVGRVLTMSSAETMDLSFNRFGAAFVTMLAEAVSQSSAKKLILRGNALKDNAAALLTAFNSRQTFIEALDLTSCGLGPKSAQELAKLVAGSTSLNEIIVDDNTLGTADDRETLVAALETGAVVKVSMRGVPLTAEQKERLKGKNVVLGDRPLYMKL
ncbi:Leucine Rich repeat [Carpediemonas membranifera]|uniref:Leucine Rich repeat n=1 Tax=Carpediemonas membranifera TaxID=201153 RepID=A0A8J6BX39_9EUKA|nr:Leucine Rich repeat [Carpediemonas membranifera]|eukprot:KAG9393066.1 Leucine Rich repeat [Carpediemonas membranifera]